MIESLYLEDTLQDILYSLKESQFVTLSGIIFGPIGIVLAIFFFFKSKKVVKPSFQISSVLMLGKEENSLPNEVTVMYGNKNVRRLTKTTLTFWNDGSEVLRGENVVKGDPLRVAIEKGDNILSHSVLKWTTKANAFSIEKSLDKPYELLLHFDYLNQNDGAVIELLHDSNRDYPLVLGSIKGVPKGIRNLSIGSQSGIVSVTLLGRIFARISIGLSWSLSGWMTLVAGAMLVTIGIGIHFFDDEALDSFGGGVLSGIGAVYVLLGSLISWLRRRRYPKPLRIT